MNDITPIIEIENTDKNDKTNGVVDIAPGISLVYSISSQLEIGLSSNQWEWFDKHKAWIVHNTSCKTTDQYSIDELVEMCSAAWDYITQMNNYGMNNDYQFLRECDNVLVTAYLNRSIDSLSACLTFDTILQLDIRRKIEKYLKGYKPLIGLVRLS
jgi:hypothetical protein